MQPMLEVLMSVATVAATAWGHHLGEWDRDSHCSALAECADCGFFAAVDSSGDIDPNEGHVFGTTTRTECRGSSTRPVWEVPHQHVAHIITLIKAYRPASSRAA